MGMEMHGTEERILGREASTYKGNSGAENNMMLEDQSKNTEAYRALINDLQVISLNLKLNL